MSRWTNGRRSLLCSFQYNRSVVKDIGVRLEFDVTATQLSAFERISARVMMDDRANVWLNTDAIVVNNASVSEDAEYYNRQVCRKRPKKQRPLSVACF